MESMQKTLGALVNVEHAWHGMSCNVCSRGQVNANVPAVGNQRLMHVTGCDLGCQARDHGYCCLFVPHEGRVKTKRDLVGMVEAHVQRWIREPRFRGL